MKTVILILKIILICFSSLSLGYEPMQGGGDFPEAPEPEKGDENLYVQIDATDGGFDTWQPTKQTGGYRYGPSMILNADGSLDLWSAATGPGDIVDVITHSRLYDGCSARTKEIVAVKPTSGSFDKKWVCDPGAVSFGGYYYIGYTTTTDERGTDNDVAVARSRDPRGPFTEKWDGNGWSDVPTPLIEYTGNPDCFGAGEPSFVVMGDTLYVYYSWCDENGPSTRVATADATDENWPATIRLRGECIPPKDGGDSADVKYSDEFGRFIAVFTEKRFSDESYVAVWESFDGLTFRRSGFVKENTAKKLHNCGISGRADGHIGMGDPVYLSYAYGSDWGRWPTRLHEVRLSLADAPKSDPAAESNVDVPVKYRSMNVIPEITAIKAEKNEYYLNKKSQRIWVMAFDTDAQTFPVLFGVSFSDYDESVIKIKGSRIYPIASGTTRVHMRWRDFVGEFTVTVEKYPER